MNDCSISDCEGRVHARTYCNMHYIRWRRTGTTEPHAPRIKRNSEERFWKKVDRSGTCWMWTGGTDKGGYGVFKTDSRSIGAHRYAYELMIGPVPIGMLVDHKCRNPGCVNPAHLQAATYKQNGENRSLEGKGVSGVRGVYWVSANDKWTVRVRHHGRLYFGGYFDTISEAAQGVRDLRNSLFTNNLADRREAL